MKEKILKLDEKDKLILLALETDARQSISSIAKKARLSQEIVSYRIKKYLKDEIITKFFIIPNFDTLGFTTYRVYLQFLATTPEKEQEILEYVRDKMPCQWVGFCDGRWDLMARISARDLFEFNCMMTDFFEKYAKYIKQKEITMQVRHTWWPSTYGLTETPPKKLLKHEIPTKVDVVKHDKIDLQILSVLSDDARTPTIEIAKKVGVSADTVHYRIKRLIENKVITQIKSYFNREKRNQQHSQVFVRLYQQPDRIKDLTDFLSRMPECFFIASMVGAWDMQFGIDSRNSGEFHEIFGLVKKNFSDVIIDYETLIVYKEYSPNPFKYYIEKM